MGASGINILKAGQRDKSSESGIVPPKAERLECMNLYVDGNYVSDKTWAVFQGSILVVIVHSARYYYSYANTQRL